jgi:type II secretory pathway component PulF
MRFYYIASQSGGKIIEGEHEAESTADVLTYLASQGLRPISLKVSKGLSETDRFKIFSHSIDIEDKVFLTKYLALMLRVGTDLLRAIDILVADFEKPALKALLIEIRTSLERGQPIHTVFLKHPKIFSSVFINMIKAGETSGNLELVFRQLSTSLQKEQDLRRQIKAAITYPIILLIASITILFILVSFALPKIANIFSSGGFEPPFFSKVVFAMGLFMGEYFWLIFALVVFFIVGAWLFTTKSITGKKIFSRMVVKAPLIGSVLRKIALQRFASTLSSLLSSGLPIIDSLEITADAVGNEELKTSLRRVAREGILKGLTIGEAFRKEPAFPRMVVNLMAISEKAGHIENILATLADFYTSEIESAVKSLVSFLEPVLLLIIGLVIGTIALSIIVPIYQLVGQF